MSGNSARRRMVKFMPSGFELRETRQPPLKDQYDEWLARVICYAFSISTSPLVNQVNRATSEILRMQSAQEGLAPLKAWVKSVLDQIVQVCLKQPDLEFAWVGGDAVDPLQQAQTLSLLVDAGIKTREEARAELGLAPEGPVAPGTGAGGVGKFNPYHDPRNGEFTTPDGAGAAGSPLEIHPGQPLELHPNVSLVPSRKPRAAAETPKKPVVASHAETNEHQRLFGRNYNGDQIDPLPPNIKTSLQGRYLNAIGDYQYPGNAENQQCVDLTQYFYPGVGLATLWRPGDLVQGDTAIPIYAPVATFSNVWPDGSIHFDPKEHPGGWYGQSHTGIYLGQDADGIYLLNLYWHSGGSLVTYFPWNAAGSHVGSKESGQYYYTIRNWNGKVLAP